jgi:DNA-binding transcriptional MerR regulator
MIARVTMIMAFLALTTGVSSTPVQAEESNEAALMRQLEEVQQQLHELQLKVQDMESKPGSAQAPSPAAVPASMPSSTPARAPAAPSSGNQPAPAPVKMEASTNPSPAAIPDAYQWREMLKDQWHSIMAGMSYEEIRKLLGTPSRELTLDGKPVWYYAYPGIGNGSVMFGRDGHTVVGWQHPPFGFW